MKKKSLKSLKLNKESICAFNTTITGGGLGPIEKTIFKTDCDITTCCPTESLFGFCYTENPNECIAPPNP